MGAEKSGKNTPSKWRGSVKYYSKKHKNSENNDEGNDGGS